MKHLLLILLAITLIGCRSLQSPKATTKSFFKSLNKQDFDRAFDYVILDAIDFVEEVEKGSTRETVEIKYEECNIAETSTGVECTWTIRVNGRRGLMIMNLIESENKWFITDFEFDRFSRVSGENEFKQYSKGPEAVINEFVELVAKKKYNKALKATILDAKTYYSKLFEDASNKMPIAVSDISCTRRSRENTTYCTCEEEYSDGSKSFNSYTMTLVGKKWKIMNSSGGQDPAHLVSLFANALSSGNCDQAMTFAYGAARESVQGSMNAGCESYDSKIMSVSCETYGDEAVCMCNEKRTGMDMTFIYNVAKIQGRWLVTEYKKDLEMEEEGDGSMVIDDIEEAVEETVEEPIDVEMIEEEAIVDFAEKNPEFPGGEEAMMTYIQENIEYPDTEAQGIVYVQYIVTKTGEIEDVKIVRGVNELLDKEAIRIVESMPKWTPAEQAGKPVAVRFTLPIHFRLNN